MIVVNRDGLIFAVGLEDVDTIPYNPNAIPMSLIDSYDHKVRSTINNLLLRDIHQQKNPMT